MNDKSHGARAVARRGLARGCASRPFAAAAVADALRRYDDRCVYVEPSEGRLAAAGAGSLADVAVRARLAPNHQARTAALALAPGPAAPTAPTAGAGAWLQLRAAADLAPHDELLLWPDDELLARLAMPFLTLTNVLVGANSATGGVSYACHLCQARFDQPHPLKVHLLLGCRPYCARAFWRRVLLAADPPPAAAPAPVPPAPPLGASPAELEALATAWGRVPAGHLCLYCGKVYSRRYGLKIHIRTHTGYKPLRCRHCARRFGDPSNLNKHVRLHAAAPAPGPSPAPAPAPHSCARCGAVCARRRDLLRHRRAKHPAPSPPPAPPDGPT